MNCGLVPAIIFAATISGKNGLALKAFYASI